MIMLIAQIDMTNRRKVRQFLDLPNVIIREISQWAGQLSGGAQRMLDRNKISYYRHSEAVFLWP
jgi:ABC-type branched-subunit amino acid transport system ATPase component